MNETAIVHQPLHHDSADRHVTGSAPYIDDLPEPAGTLHLALGLAPVAAGLIKTLELDAVRAAPGVARVVTATDIPGLNECSPSIGGDPVLAASGIDFHGQAIFMVAARTRLEARRAARMARIETEATNPIVTVSDAVAADSTVLDDYVFLRNDVAMALEAAPHNLDGRLVIGGQEHFYLEGQIALAIPGEGDEMFVHSSTQYPNEVQHIVAQVLGIARHAVTVSCRRMGGGFGGKESQASQWAALAALAARLTGRPCKLRLDRDDDFVLTGKRHDFVAHWRTGFDTEGRILAHDITYEARCGCSADLSQGVVDRTMFHADNAYFLPAVQILTRRLKTNTVSNTAFRGFGGPQGVLGIETVVDRIAQTLGRDPLDVRKANFYSEGNDITPYGQRVEDFSTLLPLVEALERSSEYRARREAIANFNAQSPILKRGIALTPVKFGISFTLMHLNQAGALVHVYADGSISINHGGTEMGQGLYAKIAQVVAEEFGVEMSRVRVTATVTDKVPNAGPTAASAGSDLNGMAAQTACREIRDRMAKVAGRRFAVPTALIRFRDGRVFGGNESISFAELAKSCWHERVGLSQTGFYATPDIHWDRATASGKPFLYFAYGACCAEVIVDSLTGENQVTRVDILHDCGRSLNPAIDVGQIEGGFVQGIGWLTTEDLVHDRDGRLRTHAPATYKIPVASDVPEDFRVSLWDGPNAAPTIYRSKAVGEPPLMLGIAVFSAISDAIHALSPGRATTLDAPATPEAIMRAVRLARAT